MITCATLIRFAPGVDAAEGRRYLRDVYRPSAASVPGVCRFVQNDVVRSGDLDPATGDRGPPIDAYVCMSWPDPTSQAASVATPEFSRLADCAAEVIDTSSRVGLLVDERVSKDGERGAFKLASFVSFRADIPAETVSDRWTRDHGPLTLRAGGFTRYVQNHVVQAAADTGRSRLPFDGFAEHWFRSEVDFHRISSTHHWQALVDDGLEMFDMDKVVFLVVDESVHTISSALAP